MLRSLLRRSLELLRAIPRTEVSSQMSRDRPAAENLKSDQLIVVRGETDKWALMRCPCGCGERLQLSLTRERRPRSSVEVDQLGRPTLAPSIRMRDGCRAHFHIRKGRIDWCRDSGRQFTIHSPDWSRRGIWHTRS